MDRRIVGFRRDGDGDWIADLECRHSQHVRDRPPFQERPWVTTARGRQGRVGTPLPCPLCDRAELPDGLTVTGSMGPFDETSVPAALLRTHQLRPRTWGQLHVLSGVVDL